MGHEATDEAISHQALQWLIALQEAPADAASQAEFEAWLARGPAHEAAWREARMVGDLIGEARPVAAELPTPRWPARSRFAVPAAAFALAASLLLVFLPSVQVRLKADHVTATGEQREIRLADDSVIHLGPDSAVAVVYGDGGRKVALLKGEAFFQVARDPDRPFTVAAGRVETSVLGTAFDVRRTTDGATVSVREGRVRVSDASSSARLGPGEWVGMAGGQVVARGKVAPELVAAWRQGQLVVKNQPIAEIVDILRRYHDGAILLRSEALGGKRITGLYDLAEPAEALSAMVSPHGASVRRLTPWILVVSD